MTKSDIDWLKRKLKVAEIGDNFDVSKMTKIVAGKKLWNYDALEPTEKKEQYNGKKRKTVNQMVIQMVMAMVKQNSQKEIKAFLGYNAIFTPEVIDDIHIKAQLGRYRMRGMALMKKIPTFDD